MENIKEKIKQVDIACIGLFLYGFSYTALKLWVFCAGAAVYVLYQVVKTKKFKLDIQIILLAAVMYLIAKHDAQYQLEGEAFKVAAPILAHLLGRALCGDDEQASDKRIFAATSALTLGCLVQGVMDVIIKIATGYLHEAGWVGLWGIYMARTAYESNFLMLLAMAAYSVVLFKENKRDKKYIAFIVLGIMSMLNSLIIMQGRTNIMTFIVTLIVLFAVRAAQNNDTKKNIKIFSIFAAIVAVAVVGLEIAQRIYTSHHDMSKPAFFLFRDGGLLHNIRFRVAKQGLKLLIENPQGGFITTVHKDITSTHNMWLEYGREFGLLVFILLVVYLVISLVNIIRVIKNKRESDIGLLLLGMFIALNAFYMLEPIPSISDSSQFVIIFFIISGMARQRQ